MCEVLLRVVDKVSDDPYRDAKLTKRGDVITVQPDGWNWGAQELADPNWRILKLPNVPQATAEGFLGPEVDTDPANPSLVLQRRAFRFNVDSTAIPAGVLAWLNDATRAEPTRTINFTAAQFVAFKQAKARRQDPAVIG